MTDDSPVDVICTPLPMPHQFDHSLDAASEQLDRATDPFFDHMRKREIFELTLRHP